MAESPGFWDAVAGVVASHPGASLVAVAGGLGLLFLAYKYGRHTIHEDHTRLRGSRDDALADLERERLAREKLETVSREADPNAVAQILLNDNDFVEGLREIMASNTGGEPEPEPEPEILEYIDPSNPTFNVAHGALTRAFYERDAAREANTVVSTVFGLTDSEGGLTATGETFTELSAMPTEEIFRNYTVLWSKDGMRIVAIDPQNPGDGDGVRGATSGVPLRNGLGNTFDEKDE
ncbi:MAG: hypothetical protein HOL85_10155 [Rhodospirillaceae bacterium]|jgi:hypothetical protein|nr:hypothetical protein [Rhodospirillaceae bacterium]MBT6136086.1 hypothetical protein [Rhodospirillaceae bacterium]